MKRILSIVAAYMILATNVIALDFIEGGIYGGVGVGMEDYSSYSSIDAGYTFVLNGGKPIVKLGPGVLGAEGEFTYTMIPLTYGWSDCDLNIMTIGAYATYSYDFSDKFYAKAKLGIVNQDKDYDNCYSSSYYYEYYYDYYGYNYNYNSYSGDDGNSINVGAGIGLGFKLNSKLRLFTDFIVLDGSDLKQLNLGLQVSF